MQDTRTDIEFKVAREAAIEGSRLISGLQVRMRRQKKKSDSCV